jgi:hypothetical protein
MKIAFYRGDTSFFSKLITWWTGTVTLGDGRVVGPFTHAELIFSDGRWFSSSEGEGGTRFADLRLAKNDPRWLVVDLPLTAEQEREVYWRAQTINGLGYDVWGILKTGWRPAKECSDRWFCSEACAYCLQAAGLFPGTPAWRYTPVDLAAEIVAIFGKAEGGASA